MGKMVSVRLSAEEYELAQKLSDKLRKEGMNLSLSEVFRMSLRNEAKRQLESKDEGVK